MTPISKDNCEDIFTNIQDQKAVLLIEPELMQIDGKPLNRHLRDSLHERNSEENN